MSSVHVEKSTWAHLLAPARPGRWAVYINQALDSGDRGTSMFLRVGEGCTFLEPPPQMPDTAYGPGWKYRFVGMLDTEACTITHGDTVHDVTVVEDAPPPPPKQPKKQGRKQQPAAKSRS